jgi:hypothetical protein
MMRKTLAGPEDLAHLPSLLGRIFRLALTGTDSFDYAALQSMPRDAWDQSWRKCREQLGMHATPDASVDTADPVHRQQYVQSQK